MFYLRANKRGQPTASSRIVQPGCDSIDGRSDRIVEQRIGLSRAFATQQVHLNQAHRIDVWIPPGARAGEYSLVFRVNSGEGAAALAIPLRVLPVTIPADDAVVIDHNSYGSSWIGDLYPQLQKRIGDD